MLSEILLSKKNQNTKVLNTIKHILASIIVINIISTIYSEDIASWNYTERINLFIYLYILKIFKEEIKN
jgi:predicted ATP-dependent serine protease